VRRWLERFCSFRSDERGNIALLFGLTLVPVAGAAGVAIDYSTASNVRTSMQTEADAAALEVARAAVDIHTNPTHASKPAADRQALVDQKVVELLAARSAIAKARASIGNTDFAFTGAWADALKTEYRVTAAVNVKRNIRLPAGPDSIAVASSATAKLHYHGVTTTTAPTIDRPGFEAGDYNRIYAYCFAKDETDPAKRRTKMTAVSSNGQTGNKPELENNKVFKNVIMPTCDADKGETLSWRLYNVRGSRTNPSNWPKDDPKYDPPNDYSPITDAKSAEIYNHYSDTLIDPDTGTEGYQFRGDAHGFFAPINMMETVVCDTADACTPGKSGNIVPSGKSRLPTISNRKCEPGKFMYIGWEDRPFLPRTSAPDYSSNNSHQWTDSDYDDIRIVISCPETKIVSYTSKISLIK
jgi:Flp pilus assembly protein TadG